MIEDETFMLIGDYLMTILLWLAALLQFAAIRDWTVRDTLHGESYRWLLCAGLSGLALRFSFVLVDAGQLAVPLHSMVSIQLIAIGVIGQALEQILTKPVIDPPHRRASDWAPLIDDEIEVPR